MKKSALRKIVFDGGLSKDFLVRCPKPKSAVLLQIGQEMENVSFSIFSCVHANSSMSEFLASYRYETSLLL